MPRRHPRGWWSLSNFDMFPFIFKKISILTMMISIQRLQRTSPWSKILCILGIWIGEAKVPLENLFPADMSLCTWDLKLGAHRSPHPLVEPRVFRVPGSGEVRGNSMGPARKSLEAQNFWQKLPKMSQSAWTGLFFQMSGFPTFKPKRVAMLAESSCHECPVQAKVPVSG